MRVRIGEQIFDSAEQMVAVQLDADEFHELGDRAWEYATSGGSKDVIVWAPDETEDDSKHSFALGFSRAARHLAVMPPYDMGGDDDTESSEDEG